MGAWIEICYGIGWNENKIVAPRVGAWIEIHRICYEFECRRVAPRVGAWIEIILAHEYHNHFGSLPVWERGLKSTITNNPVQGYSRSPCGSVD